MVRKKRDVRDGIGIFDITNGHRISAKQTAPNFWQLIEEKRENGQWVLHRWITEEGAFTDLVTVSTRAADIASERRQSLFDARMRERQMRSMRYPIDAFAEVPRHLLPGKLPPEWDFLIDQRDLEISRGEKLKDRKFCYFLRADGLRVNVHYQRLDDGFHWLHVAASFSDHIPDWDDMCAVKDLFIGTKRYALQVHPAEKDYVNISVYMLHLFCPVERGWRFPNFRPFVG